MTEKKNTVTLIAMMTPNLDTTCYRGTAPLKDLTVISQADVFDQITNPDGLQRDLSRKHAADVHAYAAADPKEELPRAFPEVVLNVRDKAVVKVEKVNLPAGTPVSLVKLTFDLDKIDRAKTVKVSRVDGNHRLYFGNGDERDRSPLSVGAPFQIHLGLTREQEANLFLDINATQKGLNTSHLSVLRSRLTPDEVELVQHPERAFARRLAEDPASPWFEMVHLGGSKAGAKEQGLKRPVTFTALQSGVRRTLSKSQYISDLVTPDAKYALIRSYWQATKIVWPAEWAEPADYLLTRNIGVTALSTFGASVIDRAMASGDIQQDDLVALMKPVAKTIDWSKDAKKNGIVGMSGNRAVLEIAGTLAAKLPKSPNAARHPRKDDKLTPVG